MHRCLPLMQKQNLENDNSLVENFGLIERRKSIIPKAVAKTDGAVDDDDDEDDDDDNDGYFKSIMMKTSIKKSPRSKLLCFIMKGGSTSTAKAKTKNVNSNTSASARCGVSTARNQLYRKVNDFNPNAKLDNSKLSRPRRLTSDFYGASDRYNADVFFSHDQPKYDLIGYGAKDKYEEAQLVEINECSSRTAVVNNLLSSPSYDMQNMIPNGYSSFYSGLNFSDGVDNCSTSICSSNFTSHPPYSSEGTDVGSASSILEKVKAHTKFLFAFNGCDLPIQKKAHFSTNSLDSLQESCV